MSERFLKYETEVENGMVDERGVLIPGAAGGATVVEISSGLVRNNELYDKLFEMVKSGKMICFYYDEQYRYPVCVKLDTVAGTTADDFSFAYVLLFGLPRLDPSNNIEHDTVQIIKHV